MTMRDRAPQARGPHEIEDFVGWEKATQRMGLMGAEDPLALSGRASRDPAERRPFWRGLFAGR